MYHNIKLSQPGESALSKVQDTTLSPMEEALFQAWSHANGIEKPDAPDQYVDLRGLYKNTNATILPNNQLKQIVDKANAQSRLQQILEDRYKNRVQSSAQELSTFRKQGQQFDPQAPLHPADVPNQGTVGN